MKIDWDIREFTIQLKYKCFELFINAYRLKRNWKIIHISPSDKIWDYQDYFTKANLSQTKYHFSGNKKVKIIWRNVDAKCFSYIQCKSIKWNLNQEDEKYYGSIIKVERWNQMVVEFDCDSNIIKPGKFDDKYYFEKFNSICDESCIYIDEDWIQNIFWNFKNNNQTISYLQLKYYKTELSGLSSDTILNSYSTYKGTSKWLKVNLKWTLSSYKWENIESRDFSYFNRFIVESLKIRFQDDFSVQDFIDIINSILEIERLNKLDFEVKDSRVIKHIISNIYLFQPNLALTIKTSISMDALDYFILKKNFKNFNLIIKK